MASKTITQDELLKKMTAWQHTKRVYLELQNFIELELIAQDPTMPPKFTVTMGDEPCMEPVVSQEAISAVSLELAKTITDLTNKINQLRGAKVAIDE